MKLLRLSIERHTYGEKKGTFSGEATFTGETGTALTGAKGVRVEGAVMHMEVK